MRYRKKFEGKWEKEELIEGTLERIYTETEDRRLKDLDKTQLNCLWWQEFFIIIAPLVLWITIFLGILIFWPSTPKLIVTHTAELMHTSLDERSGE